MITATRPAKACYHALQYQRDAHLRKPKTGKSQCGNTIAGWFQLCLADRRKMGTAAYPPPIHYPLKVCDTTTILLWLTVSTGLTTFWQRTLAWTCLQRIWGSSISACSTFQQGVHQGNYIFLFFPPLKRTFPEYPVINDINVTHQTNQRN